MKNSCDVTLHVAREEPPNSYNYERLENISAPIVPELLEIGYYLSQEYFVARLRNNSVKQGKIETIGRKFFEDVIAKHFSA